MFLRGLNKNWKNAYRAEAKFYSGNNNIFGVFPLTENTDTIFHSKPRAKVDDKSMENIISTHSGRTIRRCGFL